MSEVYEDFGGKPQKPPKQPKKQPQKPAAVPTQSESRRVTFEQVTPQSATPPRSATPPQPAVSPRPATPRPTATRQPTAAPQRTTAMSSVQGDYEIHHIGVLDGIRAVAVLIIVWFHLWQLSWLMPVAGPINLDWLPRNGCILVDLMILLSGFCLFLPYAREMVYGEEAPGMAGFYVRRVARIAPSYYIAVIIALIIGIAMGRFANLVALLGDFLPHVVFLHNWFTISSQATQLNGVLWTVAVEVQFYVLFPFIVRFFKKNPIATYLGMVAVGVISSWLISHNFAHIDQSYWVNNTLTFASVYANGILGAYCYVLMTKDRRKNKGEAIFFTVLAISCIWIYKILCSHRMSYASETLWQVDYRYLLSLVFMAFMIGTIFAVKWFRVIWDNKVMKFLAEISFNLYIWHQYIFVKLKELRIPGYDGDIPPNQLGDTAWQWEYTIICLVVSIGVATLMTFFVEKPLARLIKNKFEP